MRIKSAIEKENVSSQKKKKTAFGIGKDVHTLKEALMQ